MAKPSMISRNTKVGVSLIVLFPLLYISGCNSRNTDVAEAEKREAQATNDLIEKVLQLHPDAKELDMYKLWDSGTLTASKQKFIRENREQTFYTTPHGFIDLIEKDQGSSYVLTYKSDVGLNEYILHLTCSEQQAAKFMEHDTFIKGIFVFRPTELTRADFEISGRVVDGDEVEISIDDDWTSFITGTLLGAYLHEEEF